MNRDRLKRTEDDTDAAKIYRNPEVSVNYFYELRTIIVNDMKYA